MRKVFEKNRLAGPLLLLVALAPSLFGCAATSKFTAHKRADMAAFSAETRALFRDVDYEFERDQTVLTHAFIDDAPELTTLWSLEDRIYDHLRAIIAYSGKIASLEKSGLPDGERAASLAEFVRLLAALLDDPGYLEQRLTREQMDSVLVVVASQKNLLKALEANQVVIDQFARLSFAVLDSLKSQETIAATHITAQIDSGFAELLSFDETLLLRKRRIYRQLDLMTQFELGQADTRQPLFDLGLLSARDLSRDAAIQEIDRHLPRLLAELESVRRLSDGIEPDLELYRNTQRELDRLVENHDRELREVRAAIFVWVRAHRKMAAGVTDPADWFDISESVLNLGRSLVAK